MSDSVRLLTRCVVRQRFPPEGVLKPPQQDGLRAEEDTGEPLQRGAPGKFHLQKEKCSDSGTSLNQFTGTSPRCSVWHLGPLLDMSRCAERLVSATLDRLLLAAVTEACQSLGVARDDKTEVRQPISTHHDQVTSPVGTSARFTCSVRGGFCLSADLTNHN